MYKFTECSKEDINIFNNKHITGHIFQTSMWCDFKKEWSQKYVKGIDENGEIVLTCSLLKRKIPAIGYIGYIPRSFTCDYQNVELINEFTKYIKEYCKKEKITFLTIDPDIHLKENEIAVEHGEEIKKILLETGFKQLSSDSKNFEGLQPNFVFRLDISNKENLEKEKLKDVVFKKFHNKWRYNIRLGVERNLSVEIYDKDNLTEEVMNEFQSLMDITGKRDNFIVRNKAYFKSMLEDLYPHAKLYMVKYDLKADKEKSIEKINKLSKDLEKLQSKINSIAERIKNDDETLTDKELKVHMDSVAKTPDLERQIQKLNERIERINECDKDFIYLSGAVYLYYGDKGWYLYGASSNDFRDTMPNFTMQWAMIKDSIDLGLDVYDFRGVSGDLNPENPLYGLYKFKKGFSGDFVEFIGEFELVLNPFKHKLFKNVFPKYKEIRKKLIK